MKWAKIALPHIIALIAGAGVTAYAHLNYQLNHPRGLFLLGFAVLYALFRVFKTGGFSKINARLNVKHRVSYAKQFLIEAIVELPYALRTLVLCMLALVIARPQTSDSIEDMTSEGIDLVLALDVSVSMLSKDFKPNRLEQSKKVAAEFIDDRPFDRIGIVAYEGEAFTQVPVTTDHVVVKNGIEKLESGMLSGGTAIGMGLATAVNRLRKSDAKSKVIILLTDGVNNTGQIEPLDAAQLASLNDIRIYTIGVGTIGKAYSPVAIIGNQYKYDWAEVQIDEETLMKIAEETGGKYFRATNAEKLSGIYEEIDELEKTRFNVLKYQRKTEVYLPFLIIAIAGLLLEKALQFTLIRSIA